MPFRGLGLIPDPYDERDYVYATRSRAAVPSGIDLRAKFMPVRDQKRTASCTGFALAALREFYLPDQSTYMAPLFIYYLERELEDTLFRDSGATLRSGMKVLNKSGVCTEALHKTETNIVNKKPTIRSREEALQYVISSYERVTQLYDIQDSLANNHPVVIGVMLYHNFLYAMTPDGKVTVPEPNERIIGGHAMLCVGYQDDAAYPDGGYLIVRNSWGEAWGDQGYCYIPYAYYKPKLFLDAWALNVQPENAEHVD